MFCSITKNRMLHAVIGATAFALLATGCSSGRDRSANIDGETGAALGGSLGARRDKGASDDIGTYMKEQERRFEAMASIQATRQGNDIRLTWRSATLFDLDSAMIRQDARDPLQQMAQVFVEFPYTSIEIAGHTSSEGDDAYNLKLSERQALSVRTYLQELGVKPSRLTSAGYGSLRPVAPNDSESGRAKNERMEILVRPDAATIRAQSSD